MTYWLNSEALFVENPFSSAVETSSTEVVCTSSDDTTQQLITVQRHYRALSQSMPKGKRMSNGWTLPLHIHMLCHFQFSHFFLFLVLSPFHVHFIFVYTFGHVCTTLTLKLKFAPYIYNVYTPQNYTFHSCTVFLFNIQYFCNCTFLSLDTSIYS